MAGDAKKTGTTEAAVELTLPDSQTLRRDIQTALRALRWLSKITVRTQVDDRLVEAASKIVDDDEAWDVVYSILELVADRREAVLSTPWMWQNAQVIGQTTGLDITIIIELISLALQLIDQWKKRRQQQNEDEGDQVQPVPVV